MKVKERTNPEALELHAMLNQVDKILSLHSWCITEVQACQIGADWVHSQQTQRRDIPKSRQALQLLTLLQGTYEGDISLRKVICDE